MIHGRRKKEISYGKALFVGILEHKGIIPRADQKLNSLFQIKNEQENDNTTDRKRNHHHDYVSRPYVF